MPRSRRDKVDYEADLLLVAGLAGQHPSDIQGWSLVVVTRDGDGHFRSTACCAWHGLGAVSEVCGSYRDRFTPCSGDLR